MDDKNKDEITLYPRIKIDYSHSMYTEDNERNYSVADKLEVPEAQQPVFMRLYEDILLCFAKDKQSHYEILQNQTLDSSPDLDYEMLYDASINNLTKEVGERINLGGHTGDIVMLTCGGNFEASLILLKHLWEQIHLIFDSDVLVSIPCKDVILICRPNNEAAIEKMKGLIKNYFEDKSTQGLLSKGIYLRTQGSIELKLFCPAF